MLCFRDKTFCGYWNDCEHGESCGSALTPGVVADAERSGLPISQFGGHPTCFDERHVKSQYAGETECPE